MLKFEKPSSQIRFKFWVKKFSEATADEIRRDREEKKRYLLRKLSFRPSVDELKNRKVREMTELAFLLLTQQPRVRFLAFPIIFLWNTLMALGFMDGAAQSKVNRGLKMSVEPI